MDSQLLIAILASIVADSAPLVMAGIGETLTERAGITNLSLDGAILLSAMAGFAAALLTESVVLGFVAAMAVGALVPLIVAAASIELRQDQVAVGFVLTMLCTDLSSFLGNPFVRVPGPSVGHMAIPVLCQIPIVGVAHQDSLQSRFNKVLGGKNQLSGGFAFQSTRSDSPNLFGFLDSADSTGLNGSFNWRHNLSPRLLVSLGYQYSRLVVRSTPFFENRRNVSGEAGISGNNQDPVNWGPPDLIFSGGFELSPPFDLALA